MIHLRPHEYTIGNRPEDGIDRAKRILHDFTRKAQV